MFFMFGLNFPELLHVFVVVKCIVEFFFWFLRLGEFT